jgi:hypothetical protein
MMEEFVSCHVKSCGHYMMQSVNYIYNLLAAGGMTMRSDTRRASRRNEMLEMGRWKVELTTSLSNKSQFGRVSCASHVWN